VSFSKSKEFQEVTVKKVAINWMEGFEIKNIPEEVKLEYFISEFVKICRNYQSKQFNFDEKPEVQIEYLRKCLKAMFSLLHIVNKHIMVDVSLKFRDINAYFEFLDRNIRYAMAYTKVVDATFSLHELTKTLFKSKICTEKSVLNTILQIKKLEKSKSPIEYCDTLIHITQDNIESMKENGE